MEYSETIHRLKSLANPENVKGMARFGINSDNTLGVSVREVEKIAKAAGRDHALANQLWESGIHEARILACMVDDPKQLAPEQMEKWVLDFDSWDICDECCSHLFDRSPAAWEKAVSWSTREETFVKRAGFVLMAVFAVHDKKAPDAKFISLLPFIKNGATDERNFVKKAVNWALRQIGKRNLVLNGEAIKTAQEIAGIDSKSARWIASDAIRELTSEAVQRRLRQKAGLSDIR